MKSLRKLAVGKLLLLVTILLLSGCYPGERYFLRSFVEEFAMYNEIVVERALSSTSTKHLRLRVKGDRWVNYLSKGADKAKYEQLCSLYGDTSYNMEVNRPFEMARVVTKYPHFSIIEVRSDKDFDAEHPAGTPLNDIMSIRFQSAKEFINSGYSDYTLEEKIYTKSLAELDKNDLELSIHNLFLIFDKEPDVLTTHLLSFKCINAHGECYTTTYNYDFSLEEGEIEPEVTVTYETL